MANCDNHGEVLRRLDEVEKNVATLFDRTNSQAQTQAGVTEKLNSVISTLGELKGIVLSLQQAPARRWESLVGYILSAAVAAAIMYIFKK